MSKQEIRYNEEELSAYGFRNVESALRNISRIQNIFDTINRGTSASKLLPRIIEGASRSFDADEALNFFERFLQARSELHAFDECISLLLNAEGEESTERLCKLFSGSACLSELTVSQPDIVDWLVSLKYDTPRLKSEMREAMSLSLYADLSIDEKFSSLRKNKNRELVRIGLRDLCRDSEFTESVEALSDLADATLHLAGEICYKELQKKFGTPMEKEEDGKLKVCSYSVIGLGKLGGRELNFSSDIDIVFVYSSTDGETTGVPFGNTVTGKLSNREFFCNFARLMISKVGDVAADGLLYRVDLRLRPGGRTSDLAASFEMYQNYYESWGETWERQMLIKARVSAGDRALGKKWMQMIRPFIFRKNLDYQSIAEIRAVKERINKSLFEKKTYQNNVKLGYGGIREVEFIVQVFQLIYGGKFHWLKERNSLRAIHRIAEREFITSEEYTKLIHALIFLRELENRIQMVHGLQTYTIPKDKYQRLLLARKMGLGDYSNPVDELFKRYQETTNDVRAIYDTLFYDEKVKEEELELWDFNDNYADAQIASLKEEYGFKKNEEMYRSLRHIHDGNAHGRETPRCRQLYRKLIPSVLEVLSRLRDPVNALKQFDAYLANWSNCEGLYSFLLQNKPVLENLLLLLARSLYFRKLIQGEPEAFYDIRQVKNIQKALKEERLALSEFTLSEGRRMKRVAEILCGLKYTCNPDYDPGEDLSVFADKFLNDVVTLCIKEMGEETSLPPFALFSLGKLGGRELDFASDLDLIFLYDDRKTPEKQKASLHEQCVKLQEKIQASLTATGRYGSAYKLDLRLRPYGKMGQAVDPISRYIKYFNTDAEHWERLAYTKLRFSAGDTSLKKPFLKAVERFLFEHTDNEAFLNALRKQMLSMRKRIEIERAKESKKNKDVKLGYGGVSDIDFSVQYLVLSYGITDEELRFKPPLEVLALSAKRGYLKQEVAAELQEAYRFYRRLIRELRLESDNDTTKLPVHNEAFVNLIAEGCGFEDSEHFLSYYQKMTQKVRGHMNALLIALK